MYHESNKSVTLQISDFIGSSVLPHKLLYNLLFIQYLKARTVHTQAQSHSSQGHTYSLKNGTKGSENGTVEISTIQRILKW